MPVLDATTTLAFSAVGISANYIYAFMQYCVSVTISFLFWTFEALLPFWLVVFFITLVLGVIFAYMHFRHR